MTRKAARPADLPIDLAVRGVIGSMMMLPYERRVPAMGRITSRILSPIAGWPRRIRANLDHVAPDLPEPERRRLVRQVPDNVGRTLIELYSGRDYVEHVKTTPFEGPGVATLEAAHRDGRGAILVSGHFGNFDVPRVVMVSRGYRVGALYRPMRNPHFNRHYEGALRAAGGPIFPSTRHGLGQLLRHLRSGGMVAILFDMYAEGEAPLDFFGRTAPTALSAAELALRHKIPMVPGYGIRQPDGLSFEVEMEAPVPPSDPVTMMQAVSDSLERRARAHMEQWFWVHRRWKPERQRARAAPSMAP